MTTTILRQSKIIAFCGIDGAGKSSLIRRLKEEEAITGAVYMHKERKTTANVVTEYGLADDVGRHDWAKGAFAENVAAATAIDFLHHYDREIAPRLADGKLLICDRYALCYEAYMSAVGSRFRLGDIFERLRRPDLLIYVDAPVEVVVARQSQRGGATEDEHPEVMHRYRDAYLALLGRQNVASTFVLNNDAPFGQAYDAVKGRIVEQLASWM